jgi:hypothetical protein
MKNFAIALLLIPVVACAMPPAQTSTTEPQKSADITLSAEKRGSANVMLTLRNASDTAILYNLCPSQLQRRTSGGWENVPTDEMCTMELRELRPGASATFEKTLPSSAGPGDYRYQTRVHKGETAIDVASNSFSR